MVEDGRGAEGGAALEAVLRGHEADLYTRAVDIVVSRLRRKLEPLEAIKTLRNAGYTLALQRRAP